MVRNCIAHHNGLIQKARNPDNVKKYAIGKGIFVDKAGQLELLLNEDFNKEACLYLWMWRNFFTSLLVLIIPDFPYQTGCIGRH